MESIFKNVINFFIDKTIPLSKKTLTFLTTCLLLFLINDTFKFSFNYRTNQKINQLKEIYKMYPYIKDTTEYIKVIKNIEKDVLEQRTLVQKVFDIKFDLNKNNTESGSNHVLGRILSSAALFIAAFIVLLFTTKNRKELGNIILGLVVIAISWTALLFLIPLFDNILINYAINIVLTGILFIIFGYIGSRT